MRIAICQMTGGVEPAANLATIRGAAELASGDGAQLLTTPEMAVLLDKDRARSRPRIEAEAPAWQDALSGIARDTGLWLHIGSMPVALEEGRLANRALMFAPDGALVAHYDKMHMFDVDLATGERWRESASYRPGDGPLLVDVAGVPVGLTICYDLRFPELFAQLALAGAQLILIPAAFTVPTGEAHWHILLRARAIETGCFVIAAAQTGTHEDGRATFGHSLVIAPWGEVLLDAGTEPGTHVVDIDLERVAKARAQVPSLSHRRPIGEVSRL